MSKVDAECATGDLAGRGEPGVLLLVHRIGLQAVEFDVELDGLRDAVDRQVADDGEVVAVATDLRGGEGHLWVGLDTEEVGALQVAVAVGVVGVDARQLDGGVEAAVGQVIADASSASNRLKRPRTLVSPRCRMVNSTLLWAWSTGQVPVVRGSAAVFVDMVFLPGSGL